MASAGDDNAIRLWDVNGGGLIAQIGTHTKPVLSVAYAADGKRIVSGEHDYSVRLYMRRRSLWGLSTRLKNFPQKVSHLAPSPDNGDSEPEVLLWLIETVSTEGVPRREGHTCRPANDPPVGFVGDFHSLVRAPCRAHTHTNRRQMPATLDQKQNTPGPLGTGSQRIRRISLRKSQAGFLKGISFFTTRDLFVGGLFAAGACLYLYKGFSTKENVALNLAGVFALFVTLLPTAATSADGGLVSKLHGTSAVLFFLCIAYVSLFRSRDTFRLLSPAKRRRYASAYL